MLSRPHSASPFLTICVLISACADSSDPAGPDDRSEVASLTVDAAADWALVAFDGETAAPVTVPDPASSPAWDIGFFATSVMLNGGAAGPSDVVGHCLCQNAGASDAQVLGMTPESERSDFEAVTEADIPDDTDAWESDALAAAIEDWYRYDIETHTVSAEPENVWKVRTATGDSFAKFHVTDLEGSNQQHAGQVTFEYAVQPAAGEPFDATRTGTVDVSSGAVYYDLETGAEVEAGDDWDLLFQGWEIRVNGGVSGDGSAGASLAEDRFEAIEDAGDLTSSHYRGDAFGGVFRAAPWYRYNLDGNHQIWPTYDVYLIRRDEAVYKVQMVGYYGPTGDSRQITFRYARLR